MTSENILLLWEKEQNMIIMIGAIESTIHKNTHTFITFCENYAISTVKTRLTSTFNIYLSSAHFCAE